MPGNIISTSAGHLIRQDYDEKTWKSKGWKIFLEGLNQEDTYMFVFCNTQKNQLEQVKACPDLNILYESKPAVNPVHPANGPSNVFVILEKKKQ